MTRKLRDAACTKMTLRLLFIYLIYIHCLKADVNVNVYNVYYPIPAKILGAPFGIDP